MTLVKVCGITRLEDAVYCSESGVDLIGFIFAERSPRRVSPEICSEIVAGLPSGPMKRVGVFVDTPADEVRRIVRFCRLDMVQLHGSESPDDFSRFPVPVIRSVRIEDEESSSIICAWKRDSEYFLFDNGPGGTGRTFDWAKLEGSRVSGSLDGIRFFLAGGLGPENVSGALRLHPDGLDFNSGVESSPGRKDPEKIRIVLGIVGRPG